MDRGPAIAIGISAGLAALLATAAAFAAMMMRMPPEAKIIQTAYPAHVSPELAKAIVGVAHHLGTSPFWLADVLWLESKFDPAVWNYNRTARGLNQITKANAKRLGTTLEELGAMSAVAQMRYVREYFDMVRLGNHPEDPTPVPLNSLQRLAMSNFYVKARDEAPGWQFPGWVTDNNPQIVYVRDYVNYVSEKGRLSGYYPG